LNDREEPHRLPRESVDALFDVHLSGVSWFANDAQTAQTAPLGVFLLVRGSTETDGDTAPLERERRSAWGWPWERRNPWKKRVVLILATGEATTDSPMEQSLEVESLRLRPLR
jgi:hypothetical protein